MGDYIYALRSPKNCKKVLIQKEDGEEIEAVVGSVSYLYKPSYYYFENKDEKMVKAFESKMIYAWANTERPLLVAFTDKRENHKIKEGQTVYAYKDGKMFPFLYNDGSEKIVTIGTVVGVLK